MPFPHDALPEREGIFDALNRLHPLRGNAVKAAVNRCLYVFAVIANQAAAWCGNPPVERNQVTIATKNRGDSHFLVLFGTFPL